VYYTAPVKNSIKLVNEITRNLGQCADLSTIFADVER